MYLPGVYSLVCAGAAGRGKMEREGEGGKHFTRVTLGHLDVSSTIVAGRRVPVTCTCGLMHVIDQAAGLHVMRTHVREYLEIDFESFSVSRMLCFGLI